MKLINNFFYISIILIFTVLSCEKKGIYNEIDISKWNESIINTFMTQFNADDFSFTIDTPYLYQNLTGKLNFLLSDRQIMYDSLKRYSSYFHLDTLFILETIATGAYPEHVAGIMHETNILSLDKKKRYEYFKISKENVFKKIVVSEKVFDESYMTWEMCLEDYYTKGYWYEIFNERGKYLSFNWITIRTIITRKNGKLHYDISSIIVGDGITFGNRW